METIRNILHYLANLEWTERKQFACKFCDREKLKDSIFFEVCQIYIGVGIPPLGWLSNVDAE